MEAWDFMSLLSKYDKDLHKEIRSLMPMMGLIRLNEALGTNFKANSIVSDTMDEWAEIIKKRMTEGNSS